MMRGSTRQASLTIVPLYGASDQEHKEVIVRGSFLKKKVQTRLGHCRNSIVHDALCFLQDAAQMICSAEALRINLVNVLRAGRTRCKPSVLRHHLQPADGSAVPGRVSEDGLNFFAGQVCGSDLRRRELR